MEQEQMPHAFTEERTHIESELLELITTTIRLEYELEAVISSAN